MFGHLGGRWGPVFSVGSGKNFDLVAVGELCDDKVANMRGGAIRLYVLVCPLSFHPFPPSTLHTEVG